MSSQPSLRRLPGPHTRNRLTNYSQIKLIRAPLTQTWGRANYVQREHIRLNGGWLPRAYNQLCSYAARTNSTKVPPLQSPASRGSWTLAPAQANPFSLPQKPSCSRLHFPLPGGGGPWGQGSREPMAEALGTLTESPSSEQWRGKSGGPASTHILGRGRGNPPGDRWPAHGCPGGSGPMSGACRPPACT